MALKQLSGVDASFLYMETASSFGHVSSVSFYERPFPDFDAYAAMRTQLERRLPLLEPYRRRVVSVPFDLDHPYWINDPDFDLDFHLRHIGLPPPGGPEELGEQVARIIGRPLDRSKPLWEIYVFEGLEDGGFAVLNKVHHATIDGASGVEMLSLLLDQDPTAAAEETTLVDDWAPDRMPGQLELMGRATASLLGRPRTAMRLQVRAVNELAQRTRSKGLGRVADQMRRGLPGPAGDIVRAATGSTREPHDERPIPPRALAPHTPFNHSITPHRRFAFRTADLQRVKDIKTALGLTVNDVVMAVCAGALRRYLESHDALTDDPLVAMVPVSIRTGAETDRWTNRVSAIFARLPTDVADPIQRVRAARAAMLDAKERFDMVPADVLVDAASLAPPALANRAARLAARLHIGDHMAPVVNVVISNVPGPRVPHYLGGARMTHFYPASTIAEGMGLNITVQSYCDALDFGVVACRELMPDAWDLTDMLIDEIDALALAAGLEPAAGETGAAAAATEEPATDEPAADEPAIDLDDAGPALPAASAEVSPGG